MKKLLSVQTTSNAVDLALLIARIGIAALMLTHGLPKLAMLFSGDPVQFLPLLGLNAEFSLSLAVFAEVFCSLLLLVGFGTRLATLPLITTMVVALLFVHAADPIAKQEPALHYLLVYFVLLFAGSGKYSLDYWLHRRIAQRSAAQINSNTLSVQ
ncbi:MAG: DoxX family membrane protein [Bacteroidota bacterium]|nr:DoxX family protein [Flavisolibacter sp.]MDQ3843623.1 DoxX family membrane protein [Bacteroidota bacterium]MBD0296464.1 DoxX family protein [Flavisolibacter sp.]MBD0351164.1 DoxX family protein [Flavisolibacter sp.]MBD0365390.1 DoxX family protein [Flavisolibacter sp.]